MVDKLKNLEAYMNDIQITIPKSAENLLLPSPELIQYYKNLDNRTIWIDSEIDEDYLDII